MIFIVEHFSTLNHHEVMETLTILQQSISKVTKQYIIKRLHVLYLWNANLVSFIPKHSGIGNTSTN